MNPHSNYQILYFGLLAERRGLGTERIESAAITPAAIYAELHGTYQLGIGREHLRVAVNDEFVNWDHPLQSGDSVAFLPPMSGG